MKHLIAQRTIWIAITFLNLGLLQGQTLTKDLLKEPAEKLVAQARESGNIVRGAILFHQGNIACAKCHRPTADQDRIGPDLSRLGKDVTDVSLVESILQPSRVIKKEYQTTIVVKTDGRTSNGVIVQQDADRIILRDAQNVEQLVKIPRSEIDELVPGSKSIMPDGLVDELKGKQQFLDLLRYVIDTKERGPVTQQASAVLAKRELSDEMRGLVLLRKYNCASCHTPSAQLAESLKPAAPDLKWSANKLNPQYLANFIADPAGVKTGSTMPHMMRHLDRSAQSDSATAIVAFLTTLNGNTYVDDCAATTETPVIAQGQEVFHTVGCVACHAPRNDEAIEQQLSESVPLGDLNGKYSVPALTEFLKNPHSVRASGRMPNMQLSHREAVDVSGYLLQASQKTSSSPKYPANTELVNAGKALFQSLNCIQCHSGIIDPQTQPMPRPPSMNDLNPARGCLSSEVPKQLPQFELTQTERSQIRTALGVDAGKISNEQQIDFTLAHLNCTACHSRDSLGGVTPERSIHFQTTNMNLGEQGRIPPTLTGVGAKLKSKWMRDVLVNGRAIRPYMKTRMPQFGKDNVGHLIDLFQQTDSLAQTNFAQVKDQKKTREFGLKLVGNQGLNCVACHTYQYKIADTMPAVDVTEMSERLHKDWFYQYMLAPQRFSPNTVMPSFWPNGKAIRPDLEGTPEDQVEAVWQYLLDGRQARAPRGVQREPLEIKVTQEARMLRRGYPEMTKRGIGVGYPGGVNLAFDAEQIRLGLIWKGQFVDPSGVWYGQGHGKVRPMGRTKSLGAGPELDDINDPWIIDDGRPPQHQFKGYVLDKQRRPTFRYSFKTIQAEDFFFAAKSTDATAMSLSRRVRLDSPTATDSIRFRLAVADAITAVSETEFKLKNGVTIRIASDHSGQLTSTETGKQIIVPLTFDGAKSEELLIEYIWN
ncbi:MAG: hypothetical protein ABJZ55_07430 [Fuerstiella sp.]